MRKKVEGTYYVLTGYDPKDEVIQGPYETFEEAQKAADDAAEACYNYAYVCDKDGCRLYEEY